MPKQQWELIHAERRALISDLRALTPDQWQTRSLCPEWTVQEMVGHLVALATQTPPRFVGKLVASGFRFDKMVAKDVATHTAGTPADTLAELVRHVDDTTAPPGPVESWIGEVVVHGADIRRPLGIAYSPPVATTRQVAEFYKNSNLLIGSKSRIAGLRLVASDTDWAGHGTRGPRPHPVVGAGDDRPRRRTPGPHRRRGRPAHREDAGLTAARGRPRPAASSWSLSGRHGPCPGQECVARTSGGPRKVGAYGRRRADPHCEGRRERRADLAFGRLLGAANRLEYILGRAIEQECGISHLMFEVLLILGRAGGPGPVDGRDRPGAGAHHRRRHPPGRPDGGGRAGGARRRSGRPPGAAGPADPARRATWSARPGCTRPTSERYFLDPLPAGDRAQFPTTCGILSHRRPGRAAPPALSSP